MFWVIDIKWIIVNSIYSTVLANNRNYFSSEMPTVNSLMSLRSKFAVMHIIWPFSTFTSVDCGTYILLIVSHCPIEEMRTSIFFLIFESVSEITTRIIQNGHTEYSYGYSSILPWILHLMEQSWLTYFHNYLASYGWYVLQILHSLSMEGSYYHIKTSVLWVILRPSSCY